MKIQGKDWINVWAGSWSLLSCTDFADDFTKDVKVKGKLPFPETIIFYKQGKSSCWITKEEKDDFGNFLVKHIGNSEKNIDMLCENAKKETDNFFKFVENKNNWVINNTNYRKHWNAIDRYYGNHMPIKYIVDYLSPEKLLNYLPKLEKARVYSEPVFKLSEDYVKHFISEVSKKTGVEESLLACVSKNEFEKYFSMGKLPSNKILDERYKFSVIVADIKIQKIETGLKAEKIYKQISKIKITQKITGQTAFKGKVTGKVRIIIDPFKYKIFNDGDILVTGMTRPEFLPLLKKASAFVTDAGGILSHVAISARELKKPCIIGTRVATKVLKDGDVVEVDADNAIVRILS